MVAQVLGRESLEMLVGLDADAGPFLMDEVGEEGELVALLDVVGGPIMSALS